MNSVFGDSISGQTTVPPPLAPQDRSPGQGSVPRHIGQIEPWIGGSLATYTAWLFCVAYRDRPVLWLYVVAAMLMALWSWRRPARMQFDLMLRAVLFALIGLVMFTQSGLDFGSVGPHVFFWVSMPMLFYAFLLQSVLAWWLLGLNFVSCAASVYFAGGSMPVESIASGAGFLVVFAGAAVRMGTLLRRTDELLEARRVDAASGMLNEYGFVDYGGELWRTCRRTGIPATLVFMDVPDLVRLRQLYGVHIARVAMDKVLYLMQSLATGRHIVARLSPSRFALLMPGASREQAMEFLGDKLGRPPQIELDEDDLELIFLMNIHAAESQLQNVSFSRFFAAEHEMLDFYFSDQREGQPGAPAITPVPPVTQTAKAAAGASPNPTPAVEGMPQRRSGSSGPSTLPMSPPR